MKGDSCRVDGVLKTLLVWRPPTANWETNISLTGLQAVPVSVLRGFQKIPATHELPDGFRRESEGSNIRDPVPDHVRPGAEPLRRFLVDLNTGRLQEHSAEMDRRTGEETVYKCSVTPQRTNVPKIKTNHSTSQVSSSPLLEMDSERWTDDTGWQMKVRKIFLLFTTCCSKTGSNKFARQTSVKPHSTVELQ